MNKLPKTTTATPMPKVKPPKTVETSIEIPEFDNQEDTVIELEALVSKLEQQVLSENWQELKEWALGRLPPEEG